MTSIEPGWYKDPAEPTTQRYWDGEGWIGEPLPVETTPPPGPPAGTATAPKSSRPAPKSSQPVPQAKPAEPITTEPERPEPGPEPTQAGTTTPPAIQWPPPGMPPGAQPPPGTPQAPPGLPPGVKLPPGWPPGVPVHPAYAQLFMPAPRPHGYPLADIGRRLLARLIDIGLLILINALVNGWFIYRLYQEYWPFYKAAYQRAQANLPLDDLPQPQDTQRLLFTIAIIATALWFAYEVPAVANRGQTIGKRLLGIKVLRLEADGPIGFGRAIRRWNPMGLATLLWTCGIGFILQFVDCLFVAVDRPLHQALHDKSAATVVVDVKHHDGNHQRTGEPT